jgi:hypothetical protein
LSPSDVNYEALAAALAERLRAVVPPEVEVTAVGSVVRILFAGTPSGMYADLPEWPDEYSLCEGLQGFLDQFQDIAAEATTEPWPATAPDPMPEAFAEIRGDALIIGFGHPSEPVLALPPIGLREIERRR